jgi:protocatechuate 3,4-dioxygenase alpha subunit
MDDLPPTPGQTIGPFYGYALPYSRGHELVPPGHPRAVRLHGTVYDGHGVPIPDALLELRQADESGTVPVADGSLSRDGMVFTGWGRCGTDPAGQYAFISVEPGPTAPDAAPFFAVTLFARGLLDRLFTRVYLPGDPAKLARNALLSQLSEQRRQTLLAVRDGDGSLRFDIRLQGDGETVFLTFPQQAGR